MSELARLIRSYAKASGLEPVALKAAMVMPLLLLQKPSGSSKTKFHCRILSRRLHLWQAGNLDALVCEGRVIKHHFNRHPRYHTGDNHLTRLFSKLMLEGKAHSALRLLMKQGQGSILSISTGHPSNPLHTHRSST